MQILIFSILQSRVSKRWIFSPFFSQKFFTLLPLMMACCRCCNGHRLFVKPTEKGQVVPENFEFICSKRFTDLDKLSLKSSFCGTSFLLPSQLPQKITLSSKVIKRDSKIIIWLCYLKSVTHSLSLKSVFQNGMSRHTFGLADIHFGS